MIEKNMSKTFARDGNEELTEIVDAMLADMPLPQPAMRSFDSMTTGFVNSLMEIMNSHYLY